LIPPFLLCINTDRTSLVTSFNQLHQYLIAEFISDSLRLVLPTPVCFLSVSPLRLGSHKKITRIVAAAGEERLTAYINQVCVYSLILSRH
jgi:hypothetical protein